MKKTINTLIAAVCLLPAAALAATTVTLNPVADAYVQGGKNAAVNYGSATELRAQSASSPSSNYDSYLRFDTSAIAEQVRTSVFYRQPVSAKLRVYAALLSGSGSVYTGAYAVSDTTWSESAITWNTKPAFGNMVGLVNIASTTYAWQEIDVSNYVENEINAGRDVISLGLHNASTSSVYASANSREAANPPQLVITFNAVPTVSITAPAEGSVYTAPASVTMSADAIDDGSIAYVTFEVIETLSGATYSTNTVTAPPFTYTLDNLPAGSYYISTRARDNEGADAWGIVSFTVNPNAPPSVGLTSPADGSSYTAPASITLSANAADPDGSIASVEFYNGATLIGAGTLAGGSYTLGWTNVGAGSYSLTAKATDNQGAVTVSAPVAITVSAPNVPPSISLTAPADGSSYTAPASIPLTANAADPDGSIASVEFYDGTTLIASLTAPPYAYTWNDVQSGGHSLTAKATDNQGASSTSTPVTVSVSVPTASGIYYIHVDHLNTPRVITDASNRIVWRWDSDPFGAAKANEDPDGDGAKFTYNLRFPGQYYDKETNLHYNYFRDYDPTTGRYVQSDPIGLEGGLNTYAYVGGNPLAYIDLLGLQGSPGLGDQFNPFGLRGPGQRDYSNYFTDRFPKTISGAQSLIADRIKKKVCAKKTGAVFGGLAGGSDDIDISNGMSRFGDPAQNWYERNVQIGNFEIKTEGILVKWDDGACSTCFTYSTTMYVLENTGDNRVFGLAVERPVRMGSWAVSGRACCGF